MRRTPQMRALMLYMAVPLMIAAVGCVKSQDASQQQSAVQGVPAETPEGGTAPAPEGGAAPAQQSGNPAGGGMAPASGGTTVPAQTGMAQGGTAPVARQSAAPAVAKPPAPPPLVTVAEGTDIPVRTVQSLSTKTAENGTKFEATLREPLIVGNYVVAPKGARAYGLVSKSDDGGRVKGVASITVTLTSLEVNGKEIEISTSSVTQQAKSTKKNDAVKVGVASGIGAAIGAIAGGGKGAAIGAGAGAGAGTGVVLATKGEAAVIPSEAALTFRLRAPITVARN